jgi:ubiquinone/menaquinone biosynthesis C-methylase UbiE
MTFTYEQSDVHQRFDVGRALAPDATRTLMELLRRYAPEPVRLVVDLGCGTGRFTTALAETFAAPVLGVEPAANMRAAAEAKPHPATVRFVAGQADHIPLGDGAADVVFLSQVLHHVADRPGALREIHRVLRLGGRLCIRQTTRENLDSYFYQRFFPQARAIDDARLPLRRDLLQLAASCRFRTIAVETLRHEIAANSSEYVAKIALRTHSDLEGISDVAFREGLADLRDYGAAHPDYPKFADNDVFVFE